MVAERRQPKARFFLAPALLGLVLGAGCGDDSLPAAPGGEDRVPNTYITRGPIESTPVGHRVSIRWTSRDDTTEAPAARAADHFEIAWEDTTTWIGPITSTDSTFVTEASSVCCVEPPPAYVNKYGDTYPDSVYSQLHTLFVRAVSPGGLIDPTPAFLTFDARTIAPTSSIEFSAADDDSQCPTTAFEWMASDIDGEVASYEWALVTTFEYEAAAGQPLPVDPDSAGAAMADWLSADGSLWDTTLETRMEFADLAETVSPDSTGGNDHDRWWLAVRAVDDAMATETILEPGRNLVAFDVYDVAGSGGPLISIQGYRANSTPITEAHWNSSEPEFVFVSSVASMRFTVSAVTPTPCSEVVSFEYKTDSGTYAPLTVVGSSGAPQLWPLPPAAAWQPGSGLHGFTVRVTGSNGRQRELTANVQFP